MEPRQEVIDLEALLPIYDEYADSDWYDIEAALNSPRKHLHSFQAVHTRVNPPPKPPLRNIYSSRAPHVVTVDPTERSGSTRGIYEYNS